MLNNHALICREFTLYEPLINLGNSQRIGFQQHSGIKMLRYFDKEKAPTLAFAI